jgi:hypothetical protein
VAKKKTKMSGTFMVMSVMSILLALVFLPTTLFLILAMLPTIVAAVVDRTKKGTKTITVGAMNLAGCTPFLIDLWTRSHTTEMAMTILTNPQTMIVVYCAAGIGYLIDWAVTGIVASIMVQRGEARLKDIKKRKENLEDRWGREVSGAVPLDNYGFPIHDTESLTPEPAVIQKRDK